MVDLGEEMDADMSMRSSHAVDGYSETFELHEIRVVEMG